MISLNLSFVFAIFLFIVNQAFVKSFEVINISEENYNEIKNNENLILYFHATWASKSDKHKEEFYSLAQQLKNNLSFANKNFVLGIVSNKAYKICRDFKVESYPSIILIKSSERHLYNGQINGESMMYWVERYIEEVLII